MKRYAQRSAAAGLLVMTLGCATKSTYLRHDSVTKTDHFSDTDIRLLAEPMVTSLLESRFLTDIGSKPVLAMSGINNRTLEHIDTRAIDNTVQTILLSTNRVRFVDRDILRKMAQEKAITDLQRLDVADAVVLGNAVGAEYYLLGDLTSIDVKQGRQAIRQKKLTMRLVDIKTSEILWMNEKEIKKTGQS